MTEVQRWSDNTPSKVLEYDADYKYNAFGLLVQKVIDSDGDTVTDETSRYALDGWNPAKANGLVGRENFAVTAKLDGSNAVVTKYLWSDRIDDGLGRIDVGSPTEVRWTLTDFQKSVRTILNSTGGVIDSLAYDAFGNILPGETDATKRGDYAWTGREYDVETGLQYNRARWYDPTTGRWLTQDPLGFDAGDTNLYRYVNNAPTMAVDPSGLELLTTNVESAEKAKKILEKATGVKIKIIPLPNPKKDWNGPRVSFYLVPASKDSFEKSQEKAGLLPFFTTERFLWGAFSSQKNPIVYGNGGFFDSQEICPYGDLSENQRARIFEANSEIFGVAIARNGITSIRSMGPPETSLKGDWAVSIVVNTEMRVLGGHVFVKYERNGNIITAGISGLSGTAFQWCIDINSTPEIISSGFRSRVTNPRIYIDQTYLLGIHHCGDYAVQTFAKNTGYTFVSPRTALVPGPGGANYGLDIRLGAIDEGLRQGQYPWLFLVQTAASPYGRMVKTGADHSIANTNLNALVPRPVLKLP